MIVQPITTFPVPSLNLTNEERIDHINYEFSKPVRFATYDV